MPFPFRYHATPRFEEKLARIEKHDPPGHLRIRKVIERLLQAPDDADGRMHGVHQSRFKKYVGRRDYRLIYEWCESCRKTARKLEERCHDCHTLPDHSVVFFDVYHKNEMARIG